MKQIFAGLLLAAVVTSLSLAPAWGAGQILDLHEPLPDLDARTGEITPTATQLAEVAALGATARWNRFGTPHTLVVHGGYLATGVAGVTPEDIARIWLRDHGDLFRLAPASVDALELVNAAQLAGIDAHAVLFRQNFGGLTSGIDGLITVGVAGDSVAYVSSSSVGDQPSPAAPTLSALDAWLQAAAGVGHILSLADLTNVRQENGWMLFDVVGFSHPQRSRAVALPTPDAGVLPGFETVVLNVQGGHAEAYTSFVDGQTAEVLVRRNRVQRLARLSEALAESDTFEGTYQDVPDTPACGPLHGPYTVSAGFVRIVATAFAAVTTNDTLINLYTGGNLVASGDTAFSPEALLYEPPGGVPAGDYFVEVCPYDAPTLPPVPPFDYVGTITWEDTAVPNLFSVPKWRLFDNTPPLDLSGTDTRILGCWTLTDSNGVPVPGCDVELQNTAARAPWDVDIHANTATLTTIGNAAVTAEAWLSPLTPAEGYRPVALDRNYDYPWANTWYNAACSPTVFVIPGLGNQANDVDAATANLFAMHNRMHDWAYFLGFTERNYNLQTVNFGNTPPTQENDPEIGNVQAGAVSGGAPSYLGRDNANQITLNDGIAPITNMYLWQPIAAAFYAPCVDGDFDMGVIAHEYGHAIQNRMVGGPDEGLIGAQAGAMGESWSDLTAVEFLLTQGFAPQGSENPFAVGAYATGNGQRGIRNYGMNVSPLNYSNVGYDITGAQVHADGEIWSATNYRIREAFIARHNATYPASDAVLQGRCAAGELPADQCPGNRRWIQLVHDAFLLMPSGVSMLDARDAYLAADVLRFGGDHQTELWREFAHSGMGRDAFSNTSEDADPIPSFASPAESNGVLRFKAVSMDETVACAGKCKDENGQRPLAATIYVGHYEARSTSVATTIADHGAAPPSVEMVPGTYEFLVAAPGYGHFRFQRTVTAGEDSDLVIYLPTNWASLSQGASATGDGINHAFLIDDTEATNWANLTGQPSVAGSRVTVALGYGLQAIDSVQVSALLRPVVDDDPGGDTGSQNRFSALRQFEIWTCTADITNLGCNLDTGFTKIYTSAADAFPGQAPRPAVPDLILRTFDVPDTQATHVRIRVVSNQCTGGPAFQGDQDADPLNNSDCVAGSSEDNRVRIAELQIFSAGGAVVPAGTLAKHVLP